MNCNEINKNLIFYIEKSLEENIKSAVEEHIQNCTKCMADYKILLKAFEQVKVEKELKVNPFISTQILAKTEKKTNKNVILKYIMQPIAASVIILMVIWFGHLASDYYLAYQLNKTTEQTDDFTYKNEIYVTNDYSYEDYYFVANQ